MNGISFVLDLIEFASLLPMLTKNPLNLFAMSLLFVTRKRFI